MHSRQRAAYRKNVNHRSCCVNEPVLFLYWQPENCRAHPEARGEMGFIGEQSPGRTAHAIAKHFRARKDCAGRRALDSQQIVRPSCAGREITDDPRTTFSNARAHLASLMDQVTHRREPVLIRRRGKEPVVLVAAEDLAGWIETASPLRSSNQASRLLDRSSLRVLPLELPLRL